MDKQYDVSLEMKKLFEKKQKQRAEAKEYFQKLLYNPYRSNTGVPFDPAVMRFHALHTYYHDLQPATPKTFFKFLVLLSPLGFLYYAISDYRKRKEAKFRSGLLKYEDRYNEVFFF